MFLVCLSSQTTLLLTIPFTSKGHFEFNVTLSMRQRMQILHLAIAFIGLVWTVQLIHIPSTSCRIALHSLGASDGSKRRLACCEVHNITSSIIPSSIKDEKWTTAYYRYFDCRLLHPQKCLRCRRKITAHASLDGRVKF